MAQADEVRVEITAQATSAEQAINGLKGTLETLKASCKGGLGLGTVAKNLQDLGVAAGRMDASKIQSVVALTEALKGLQGIGKISFSGTVAKNLQSAADALGNLTKVDMAKFRDFGSALSGLKDFSVSKNLANQITKVAEAAVKMNGMDFTGIKTLSDALAPMANSLGGLNTQLVQTNANLAQMSSNRSSGGRSMVDIFAGLKLAEQFIGGFARKVAQAVTKANDFIEDYNLFTVSLGRFADQAEAYADKVSDLMGIDPSKWMRNQGIFMTLSTGFGVAADRAYIMSKNLTQLGYDLSSFFNIATEGEGGSMQKLQAALSGELEPLRRLGFDLSEARLKAVALSLGIDQTFNSMTQAQKAQLRYYAILNQVTTAQGDMARTLDTPANQLRILKQQTEQAARAFGNIFIPVLNQLLPYANAVAAALREIAEALASFFGFKLPTVDYSDVVTNVDTTTDSVDNLGTSIGGASKKAKELKGLLADWDELNIIQSESGGGGGSGGGRSSGAKTAMNPDDWTFALPEYDFLKNYAQSAAAKIKEGFGPTLTWIKDNIAGIVSAAEAVGGAMLMWKIANPFVRELSRSSQLAQDMSAAVLAIGTATITLLMDMKFTDDYLKNKSILSLISSAAISSAGAGASGLMIGSRFGAKAGAGTAGAVLTLTAAADLALAIQHVKTEGKIDDETMLSELVSSVKAGLGVGLMVSGATGNVALGLVAGVITFGVTAGLSFVLNQVTVEEWKDRLEWGDVSLTADEIQKYVQDNFFDRTVTAQFTLLDSKIANVEEVKKDLDSQIAAIGADLNAILLRGEVAKDDPAVQAVVNQITGEDGLISKINGYLATSQEALKLSVAVVPLGGENNGNSAALLSSVGDADTAIGNAAASIGKKIADAISAGFSDEIGSVEREMVNELWQSLVRIQQAVSTGQTSAEFEVGVAKLSNFTRETFGGALTEYLTLRNDAIADAESAIDTTYILTASRVAGLEQTMTELSKRAMEDSEEYRNAKKTYDGIVNSDWYKELIDPDWRKAKAQETAGNITARGDEAFRKQIMTTYANAFADVDWFKVGDMIASQATTVDSADTLLSLIFSDVLDVANIGGHERAIMQDAIAAGLVTMTDFLGEDAMESIRQRLSANLKHTDSEAAKGLYQDLLYSVFGVTSESEGSPIADNLNNFWGDNNVFPTPDLSTVETALNWLETKVSSTVQKVKAELQSIYSMSYYLGKGGGSARYTDNTNNVKLGFARYAEGGLPEVGEMFIANEDGPELIGQIGSRTAVANSDQIVSGVASGVAAGQAEQNRLLREQNAYLKVIAAKSGKAVFAPSVEMARTMRRSEEMRLQAEGV